MSKFLLPMIAVSGLLFSVAAYSEETGMRTEGEADEIAQGAFDTPFDVSVQTGAIAYDASPNDMTRRMVGGVGLNWNASEHLNLPGNESGIYYGLETGAFFSHLGAPGSNFFGADSPSTVGANSNLYIVPMNVRAGYKFADNLLVTAHTGANMMYRTFNGSIDLGDDVATEDSAKFFPNVGATLGFGATNSIALLLRSDLTITPESDPFVGTLGVSFPLR